MEPHAATPQHRPTTLGLTFESDRSSKMGLRSFSPNHPKVTFADQVPQVQSRTLPPRRQMKKSDGENRQSRKRYMRSERGRRPHETSFDADDEEMETPRSSVASYPLQTWPGKQDSLTSFPSINTISTNLSKDSPPSSDIKTEVIVHSSPRHNALEPAVKTSGLKLLQRQEAVETPSEDEGDEDMEDEEDNDDLSFTKLIPKSNSFKNGSSNAIPVSLEPDEPQLYEDDNSDQFQNSLKKSLLYLSSSLPESRSHIT